MPEPHEKPELPEEDDAPLELEPLELEPVAERPAPALPPIPADEPGKPGRGARGEEEESEEEDLPPTLSPFTASRILAWPCRGRNAFGFWISFGILFLALSGLWLVGLLQVGPVRAGLIARTLFSIALSAWFLAYAPEAMRAALRRNPAPPAEFGTDATGDRVREGVVTLVIVGVYALLPLVVGWIHGRMWGFTLLAVVWYPIPAAILGFAASGRVFRANPGRAIRAAVAGGRDYAFVVVPGMIVMLLTAFSSGWPGEPLLEAGLWLVLVYTSLLVSLLALENESFRAEFPEIEEHVAESDEEGGGGDGGAGDRRDGNGEDGKVGDAEDGEPEEEVTPSEETA